MGDYLIQLFKRKGYLDDSSMFQIWMFDKRGMIDTYYALRLKSMFSSMPTLLHSVSK